MTDPVFFTIERGVPIVPERSKYPFLRELQVGDSFLVPDRETAGRIKAACYKTFKYATTQRKEKDGKIRIWRTA